MAQENDADPRPFDVRTIRFLIRLMSEHDLSEIDLAEGEQRIRLRRGPRVIHSSAAMPAGGAMPLIAPSGAHLPPPSPSSPSSVPAEASHSAAAGAGATGLKAAPASAPAKNLIEIKSPTVGTFYAQKEPGSPPFVSVGSRVSPATVVCLIEAMKVYNEIPAECNGVITEVCVKNKDFVEFNTVLFRVDPAG